METERRHAVRRWVTRVIPLLLLTESLAGLVGGLVFQHGQWTAIGVVFFGLLAACLVTIKTQRAVTGKGFDYSRWSFVAATGLAAYVNSAWILWACGVPLAIGTVQDGRMGENYWLGPVAIVYAVLTFLVYAVVRRGRAGRGGGVNRKSLG
ncbi:hypothetical protein R70006_05029 [Paraburkholderia domus]|uniref:hypothetical protein n=1 Tax=Paraburkholderia domus TaxID=2793075 RepID=UPI001914382D|nr:hypothetical protein [Paraburkholderia domus]MBK5051734.1 hypothetical protein [Burkholderia sp. R-70006]CAE6794968.1 hypothetical protein R70006_05029 [Paraburkholderia domus]